MNTPVILLGALQGATEFLPVSSSGHLALAQIFLGFREAPLAYDLLLHLATVLATVLYFARDILELGGEWLMGFFNPNARRWAGWRYGWSVIVATLLTAAVGLPLKPYVEFGSTNSLWVGSGLLVTAGILLVSRWVPVRERRVGLGAGILVGLVQGIAVMPGVSRSGSTIVGGLVAGLEPQEAFRFSFLLSLPAILGANLVELHQVGGIDAFLLALPQDWGLGFAAAFVAGLLSLLALRRISLFGAWWVFGVYCLVLGGSVVAATFAGGF